MLSPLWQICDIIGLIFIVANGQILKNNILMWSHWINYPLSKVKYFAIWVELIYIYLQIILVHLKK